MFCVATVVVFCNGNPGSGLLRQGGAIPFLSSTEKPTGTGSLSIATHPDGAKVIIDGQFVGISPLKLHSVLIGSRTVKLEKVGYPVREEAVDIQSNQESKLHVSLHEQSLAVLEVRSVPEQAKWWLDGKLQGVTPQRLNKISPGTHYVLLRKPGYQDLVWRFEARKGELSQLQVALIAKEYQLTILTEPEFATVEFINSSEPYKPGILMQPGQYFFWISAPGYERKRGRVTIKDRDWVGHIRLQKLSINSKAPQHAKRAKSKAVVVNAPVIATPDANPPAATATAVKLPATQNNQPVQSSNGSGLVADLLAAASDDMRHARLLSPASNNARQKYRQVLALQPENGSAMDGLQQVKRLAESGYLVIVRSLPRSHKREAEQFLSKIHKSNLPGFVIATTIKGKAYLRVYSGLFHSRAQAVVAQNIMVEKLAINDTILRRYRSSLYNNR